MSNKTEKTARTLIGRVISNKMHKTINVLIAYKVKHPEYGKYISRRTKKLAHDETNSCQMGDLVKIAECRPLSRHKNWQLVEILEKAAQ
jgi:small subunit ribosomal protein S17